MAACPPNPLLADAACFQCLSEQELAMVHAVLLCQILQATDPMATCNPSELLAQGSCFQCLTAQEIQIAQLQLLCNIASGGAAPAQCGAGNPNTLGLTGAFCGQLFLDTDSDTYYIWNSVTEFWA